MIARLEGRVAACTPGSLVLDVGGVGYEIQISLQTFYALSARRDAGASIHVHTHVREDAITLFGFHDEREKLMFRELIGITGIGPRVALAILSGIGADELARAVESSDRVRLQRIPGVGKKTAERVLLELGDRLRRAARRAGRPTPAAAPEPGAGAGSARSDAISALVNLGYGEDVAAAAVDRALAGAGPEAADPGDLEAILRRALGALVR